MTRLLELLFTIMFILLVLSFIVFIDTGLLMVLDSLLNPSNSFTIHIINLIIISILNYIMFSI